MSKTILDIISDELNKNRQYEDTKEEDSLIDDDNPMARKSKTIVEFEDQWFDAFSLIRLQKLETYDTNIEDVVFSVKLIFLTQPFEIIFNFNTDEQRTEKIKELKSKLQKSRIKFT